MNNEKEIAQRLLESSPYGVVVKTMRAHRPDATTGRDAQGVLTVKQSCSCGWVGHGHTEHVSEEIVQALQVTPRVIVHMGDPDARAEVFNEGYDAAMAHRVMGDEELESEDAADWLQGVQEKAWAEGFETCWKAAPIIPGKTWALPDNPYNRQGS